MNMSPAHAAAAAAFAVAGAPCPLTLPPGTPQPPAEPLPEAQQLAVLNAALAAAASSAPLAETAAVAASATTQMAVAHLQRRRALLSAFASLAECCPASTQQLTVRATAAALQQAALDGDSSRATLGPCLQQLLTSGCPAPGVLQAAALLQALHQQPEHAPPGTDSVLASPEAASAAQQAVALAAEAAVTAALHAMSGRREPSMSLEPNMAPSDAGQKDTLSTGDAVQDLYALLRSLHDLPNMPSSDRPALGSPEAAAATAAAAEAVGTLRTLVWQRLQQHAAEFDGSGGAAATEAHLQVCGRCSSPNRPRLAHALVVCAGRACAAGELVLRMLCLRVSNPLGATGP